MKFAVDHVTGKVALLENIENGDKIEIVIDKLPKGIVDGDVVSFSNGIYERDEVFEKQRLEVIREKMERLKRKG